jgi:Mn-dependent DtxR family transcriptional regulator
MHYTPSSTDAQARIVQDLSTHPGWATTTDVVARCEVAASTGSDNLHRLESRGLVESRRVAGLRQWRLTHDGVVAVAQMLGLPGDGPRWEFTAANASVIGW